MFSNSQYPMKGMLKKVCDYYDNCWVYTYTDLTGQGMIAPSRVDNTSAGTLNNVWAKFWYLPVVFPYPNTTSFIQLLDHIDDSTGRTWSYTYNVEIINAQQQHYMFVGAQGAYPRLEKVSMGKTGDINDAKQWLYEYYKPEEHGYDVSYRGRSQFLDKVTDRTDRVVAEITYVNRNDLLRAESESSFTSWSS